MTFSIPLVVLRLPPGSSERRSRWSKSCPRSSARCSRRNQCVRSSNIYGLSDPKNASSLLLKKSGQQIRVRGNGNAPRWTVDLSLKASVDQKMPRAQRSHILIWTPARPDLLTSPARINIKSKYNKPTDAVDGALRASTRVHGESGT